MRDDVEERLDRLESLVERQQRTIERQRERIGELGGDPVDDPTNGERENENENENESGRWRSRRAALGAAGLVGAGGFATGFAAGDASSTDTAAPTPEGQVGTASRPLRALYTASLDGPVTGDTEVDSLAGDGLTVSGTALSADAGEGLTTGSGALAADAGDGLRISSGALATDGSALAGSGLTAPTGSTLAVDLAAIAGDNLTVDSNAGELDAAGAGYTGVSVYRSSDQSTTGLTKVDFDSAPVDPDGNFDLSSATYAVPADGVYAVTFKSYTDAHLVSVRANGANGRPLVDAEPPVATRTVRLTAGDTVAAYVDGGGTVYGGAAETYLSIDKLG